MTRTRRWPSKWWFWVPFVLANLYAVVNFAWWFAVAYFPSIWLHPVAHPVALVFEFLDLPLDLLLERYWMPLLYTCFPMWDSAASALLLFLILWQPVAAMLGLIAYGSVFLVYVIAPQPSGRGEEKD